MPADLMSLEAWLKNTDGGALSTRSSRLKGIDTALEAYHKSPSDVAKDKVRSALMAWMKEKGPGWKTSTRNRKHAVDDLFRQLMIPGAPKSPEEMLAVSTLQYEQEALLDLFYAKRFEWRQGYLGKLANNKWGFNLNLPSAAWSASKLAPHGGGGGAASKLAGAAASAAGSSATAIAAKIVDAIVPGEIAGEVMQIVAQVSRDFMAELVQAVTPFVGVITSGGTTLWNLKNFIRSEYRVETSRTHAAHSLSVGNPELAIKAIVRILERERNADAFSLSVSIVDFAGKLAGTLADGGTATTTAIGLASSVAKLTNIVRIIVRDVLEKNEANKLMANRRLTVSMFGACPILGAYYVCCAPTSVLVNQILERWSQGGWQGEVELNVTKHIEPLRSQARRLIREHRFVIPSLLRMPGMLGPNKDELARMQARMGKTGMAGIGSNG